MRTVATAGHVDHGKSTLLKAVTGQEPDRWAEEQERGLTIDLGFVWTELEVDDTAVTVAFVDVPGHEDFVGNMLAGAGGVRVALFVVAADDGWQAQSQEHLEILDLLDIPAAVVAVTKADLVDEERVLEVAADVEARLAATSLAGAPIEVVDAVSGRGVDELADRLARRLAATDPPGDRGRPRLWIDRSFTIAGSGTVVTGTLAGGRLADDRDAAVLPGGRPVRIRGLHSLSEPVAEAGPGDRVGVNLAGIDREQVGRGDALVADADDWLVTGTIEASLRAVAGYELGHEGAWQLHTGSASTAVEVLPVLGEPITAHGGEDFARLRLERPLPLQVGDRFVLRDTGARRTAGGGRVLDPAPGPPARGPDRRLERLAALEAIGAGRPSVLAALLEAAGGARPETEAAAATGTATAPGVQTVGDWLATSERLELWVEAVRDRLADEQLGLSRGELAAAAEHAGCPPGLARLLPDHLAEAGELHRSGTVYVLEEHAESVERARRERRRALLDLLEEQPLAPPALAEAAERAGVSSGDIQQLEQEGRLVRAGELAFTAAAVEQAVEALHELAEDTGPFTASQARQAWDTSRKYAIPLLEHLDGRGVTDFDGTHRTLREGS